MRRRILQGVAVALVLLLAWTGINGGINEIPQAATAGQRVQAYAQLAYGALSLAVLAAAFWARRLAQLAIAAWVASLTIAAFLAPIAWGGTGLGPGIAAGAASLAIGLAVGWALRQGTSVPLQNMEQR